MTWLAIPMVSFLLFLSSRLRRDKLAPDIICHVLFVFSLIFIMHVSCQFFYAWHVPFLFNSWSLLLLFAFLLPYESKNVHLAKGLTVIVLLSMFVTFLHMTISDRVESPRDEEIFGDYLASWILFLFYVKFVATVCFAYIAAKIDCVYITSEKLIKDGRMLRRAAYVICILSVIIGLTLLGYKAYMSNDSEPTERGTSSSQVEEMKNRSKV